MIKESYYYSYYYNGRADIRSENYRQGLFTHMLRAAARR